MNSFPSEEKVESDVTLLFKVLSDKWGHSDIDKLAKKIAYGYIDHLKSGRALQVKVSRSVYRQCKFYLVPEALEAKEDANDGLMRVIVTHAHKYMKSIKDAFCKKHEGKIFSDSIAYATSGLYKNSVAILKY
ncbi:hypothetical protein L2E82_11301 [Cichorium intybus]|uniref:Uncharacterized protein n=1 Tax=Cichorium intybus TaxID=13427 RepID=A0ACB9GD51_CICIN|nr:hypothetical protein L2E82_11301 [Cichorium intybus]